MTGFLFRTTIGVVLGMQLVGAAAYWWLSPKGFPISSGRFWLNSVLPLILVAVALVGLVGMSRSRRSLAAVAVLSITCIWLAAAVFGYFLFPASFSFAWL